MGADGDFSAKAGASMYFDFGLVGDDDIPVQSLQAGYRITLDY